MSFEIVEDILSAHRGARFYKADLHVHTPGSNDWDEKNKPEDSSANISAEQVVQAGLDAGLEIIAITDHNSVEWCDRIISAAKGTKLTVFPGFELTARPGVHILSIFPPEKPIIEIRNLLIKLGINDFGNPLVMTTDTIEDASTGFKIIRTIREADGLVIPAHIDVDSGIVGRLKAGLAVKEFFDKTSCSIIEIKKTIPEFIFKEMKNKPSKYAILSCSDAHQLSEIGSKPLWVKMDSANIAGLSQIGFEPSSRLLTKEMVNNPKSKILGMYSDGGLLGNNVYAFNEDLNCIIGGRGSGKSAIIDYLRFVFNDEPFDDDLRQKFYKRLVDLVRESTKVWVLVEDTEGRLWLYERIFSSHSNRHANTTRFEITSSPAIIYQYIYNQHRLVKFEGEFPPFKVEFYGQGEVQSITNTAEPNRQLKLIDTFAQSSIKPKQLQVQKIEESLEKNEDTIIEKKEKLEELFIEINSLDDLRKRVSEIENDLTEEHIQNHQVWEDANTWIDNSLRQLNTEIEKVKNLSFSKLEEKSFNIQIPEGQTSLDSILHEINSSFLIFEEIEKLRSQFDDCLIKIKVLKATWDLHYENELTQYTSILKKQGVENLSLLNKELSVKRSQIDMIENQLIPQKNDLEKIIPTLLEQRSKYLQNLWGIWDEIRECRIQAAKTMTKRLGGDVKVSIADERNVENYLNKLDDIAPDGIQSKDKQIQKIVDYSIKPNELVDYIRKKDLENLRNIGITERTANLLLQISEKHLMELERVYRPDIAHINLILEGKEKSLSDLSDGEKCTAILSVILLDESRPLVIDQPEDELDHAFIMSNVVNTLIRVKQKWDGIDNKFAPQKGRQFIIATHNQNIPVLGDSELIIKMKKVSGQNRCEYDSAFGLEHPETIKHILSLEGGSDAFERRRRKYSIS